MSFEKYNNHHARLTTGCAPVNVNNISECIIYIIFVTDCWNTTAYIATTDILIEDARLPEDNTVNNIVCSNEMTRTLIVFVADCRYSPLFLKDESSAWGRLPVAFCIRIELQFFNTVLFVCCKGIVVRLYGERVRQDDRSVDGLAPGVKLASSVMRIYVVVNMFFFSITSSNVDFILLRRFCSSGATTHERDPAW